MARRSPLAAKAALAQIPGSVGGWNARDPLPEMVATDAAVLDNFVPGTGGVALRGGTQTRNRGAPGAINTLLRHYPANGDQRLWAFAAGAIYDATAPGVALTNPAVTGLASDRWQGVQFGTPGGYFVVGASGYDQPRRFDGTSWSTMTLAAPANYPYAFDATKLMAPFAYANRLYFVERGTLRVWYLPLYAIQATGLDGSGNRVQYGDPQVSNTCVQVLDLAAIFTLGGSLVAMVDWTRDGGQGSGDYAVLISSAGQVAMYSGTNPNATDSSAFALIGIFRIPPPIGTRCTLRLGADVGILTQTGALPLSSVLSLSEGQDDQAAFTNKIRGAFRLALQLSGGSDGWELAEYPKGSLAIVNVPTMGGVTGQFVMNQLTGAWCSFSGLPATCFGLFGDALMFGTADGRVVQYDVGSNDDGAPIVGDVIPAFSQFRQSGKKRFLLARPLFYGPVGYRPSIALNAEYDASRPTLTQGAIPPALTRWGSPWRSPWGTPIRSVNQWQGVRGLAEAASIRLQVASLNPCRLDHIDVQFETGGNF